MAKVTLDEHCGRTSKDFNSKRLFANHFKTHSDEVFKCPKCPDVWENGPENQFNRMSDPWEGNNVDMEEIVTLKRERGQNVQG